VVKEEIYTEDFFKLSVRWKECYSQVTDWLRTALKPNSVIDFGCGNGFIISELKRTGCSVVGVEGSVNALAYIPENVEGDIKIMDVTQTLNLGKYDLVVSSEVAEHLPEKRADTFLDNLVSHASNMIFLTAAEPGQGGLDHVNEQPHEYWIGKLNRRGFILLEDKTEAVRKHLRNIWRRYQVGPAMPKPLSWNAMIFKRATGPKECVLLNHQLISSRIGRTLPVFLLRYLKDLRKKAFLQGLLSVLRYWIC
jgi:SAM-dependent methyltransferase